MLNIAWQMLSDTAQHKIIDACALAGSQDFEPQSLLFWNIYAKSGPFLWLSHKIPHF
jgi:hypothetical protein